MLCTIFVKTSNDVDGAQLLPMLLLVVVDRVRVAYWCDFIQPIVHRQVMLTNFPTIMRSSHYFRMSVTVLLLYSEFAVFFVS